MHRPGARLVTLVTTLIVVGGGCGRIGGGASSRPASTATAGPLAPNATMVHDVDGDTIDVTINGTRERVRLIGVDTPETKKPNTPVQCYGPEASARTSSELPVGTPLYLERDVVGRDDYGRLLAYVYRSADGLFVNLDLARHGYARPLPIPPNTAHADDFDVAIHDARAGHLGLWAKCAG